MAFDPSRYIIGRPGVPIDELQDATSHSDWQTLPTYTTNATSQVPTDSSGTLLIVGSQNAQSVVEEEEFLPDPNEFKSFVQSCVTLGTVQQTAFEGGLALGGGVTGSASYGGIPDRDGNPLDIDYASVWRATTSPIRSTFTAMKPATSSAYNGWKNSWLPTVTWPASAIGYEVETIPLGDGWGWGTSSLVVSAQATVDLDPFDPDCPWPATTHITMNDLYGDVDYTDPTQPTVFGVDRTIENANTDIANAPGQLSIYESGQIVKTYTPTVADDVYGMFSIWQHVHDIEVLNLTGWPNIEDVYAGHTQSIAVQYLLQPRPFRWIYGWQQTPPLRIFPRSDALAGGAARTLGNSRANQSSNRTIGGHW